MQANIPTLAELGYRGHLTYAYFGLVAPARQSALCTALWSG
jgi:hypothetical protein